VGGGTAGAGRDEKRARCRRQLALAAMEGGAHEFDGSTFKECFSLSWRNPYVLRLAFSAGIGGLLFGYDTGALRLRARPSSCLCCVSL
jgi:hypothetical protein